MRHQQLIEGGTGQYQPLEWVLVNGTPEEAMWDELVRKYHYLGYEKMIGPRVKYIVYWQETPLCAISFNRASLRVGARDKWLGWDEADRKKFLPHVVSNNRFLILPWVRVKNLASHILGRTLRIMVGDWYRLYGVHPYGVETFVDLTSYRGTCYKAANWLYLGDTRGFGKTGKAFTYHGKKKAVFFYLIDKRLKGNKTYNNRPPLPKFQRADDWIMMLSKPDWSRDLFEEVGLNEESIAALGPLLGEYMDYFSECFSREAQKRNAEIYTKGLLSDMDRKSVEPIALRYLDENGVRTMQQFQKDSPWDDAKMKTLFQDRVLDTFSDPDGMCTVDGSDFAKKGNHSAGVARQYCGRLGKIENCQAGVFIGYSSRNGYGLLNGSLYLPEQWFDDDRKELRNKCDIPEDAVFQTKPQLALGMINAIQERRGFPFKWVGCDSAFGCDSEFRSSLPASTYFFADIRSNQLIFRERPKWVVPERKSKYGKAPTVEKPSIAPVPVSDIAADESVPWSDIVIMEGAKGPVQARVKCIRVLECIDGKDNDEVWLYIRKYENNEIRYAVTNAPTETSMEELHHAATLRWPIEQCFQECKSHLGMADYETRSYVAWHRHMLLVMIAFLFVLEVRLMFQKKR